METNIVSVIAKHRNPAARVDHLTNQVIVMSIELLWLIPVIAAAFLVPIIVFSHQKKPHGTEFDRNSQNLAREVERYNEGGLPPSSGPAEKRLSEIEVTINRVSQALSSQQQIIKSVAGKDAGHDTDVLDIKEKLHELQREYDIVISENYSLRSRIKKLIDDKAAAGRALPQASAAPGDEIRGPGEVDKADKPVDMHMYDDTRMFKQSDLTGGSEMERS
jgi:hypothetical protein